MSVHAKSTKAKPKEHGRPTKPARADFAQLTGDLAEIGRGFYARGWALGTSGNFSAVLSHKPLRLAITSTGLDKGNLAPGHFLEIDESAEVVRGESRPSAEALLHLTIVRGLGAGAVLHTHSVWSTVLSGTYAAQGGLALEGYEMLKGLEGVRTHTHREWLATESLGRTQEARDVRGLRALARSKTLRLRRCCKHCGNYQLVARVGNAVVAEGSFDEMVHFLS